MAEGNKEQTAQHDATKMNTVIVVDDFGYISGGAEKVAIMSAVALAAHGVHVVYFCGKGPICKELKESNADVICLEQEEALKEKNKIKGALQGLWNFSAKEKMKALLENYDPNNTVIHIHGWSKVFSSSIFIPIKKKGFSVLFTCHDYFLSCPNGCSYDFVKREICERKALTPSCIKCNCDKRNYAYKVYRVVRERLMIRAVNGTDLHIAFISDFNRRVSENRILVKYKGTFITNPISVEYIETVPVSENDEYIYIGRLSYEKGIQLFCEAIQKMNAKGIVVGSGADLEPLKIKYPQIEFAGWKDKDEMRQYIRRARALIFPSVWYEGAPLTIPEVMGSYHLPCLVSDGCAGKDYIDNGKTGLLFKCGSVDSLCDAIRRADDNSLITVLQKNIEETFDRDIYSEETHVKNLLNYYSQMIESV